MSFIKRINETSTKMFATRTVLFLQNDGTLKPLAIELSLPHPNGNQYGAVGRYTPLQRRALRVLSGNNWILPEEAVPADLIKRHRHRKGGMTIEDSKYPEGVRLLIDDYPYAVDALKIWSAIKSWVTDYCSLYYKIDEVVQNDNELQSW